MGDHRIDIKIELNMHGEKQKQEWWLNYSDHTPEKIAEFVRDFAEIAMNNYFARNK